VPLERRYENITELPEAERKSSRIALSYKLFILIFLMSVPLVNPWVRGDGVGYYSYIRAILVEHDLNFEYDWLHANPEFRSERVDQNGHINPAFYTTTHHLVNHFSVGPAILWAPFLSVVHITILGLNRLGFHLQADGYAKPYVLTMAIATAIYGFGALLFSFALARHYVEEKWVFLSVIGIWLGSSLPVYMYLNPSWSHAHSAFVAALFLWYWHRTRKHRSLLQWILLGLISGLMIDVYYPNAILLAPLGIEALQYYWYYYRKIGVAPVAIAQVMLGQLLCCGMATIALLPTFLTRKIIYGNVFDLGYTERWFWTDPKFLEVLFSSHGLFSWTPILILAVFGLGLTWKQDRLLTVSFVTVFICYLYLIASYENWFGISSYGNRFFVSLTPLFVLGLAALLRLIGKFSVSHRTTLVTGILVVVPFVLWNVGLMLQWGLHLVPVRGDVSWREVVHNQFTVVPRRLVDVCRGYLFRRSDLMRDIENKDLEQLKK
jgi:hypothetical protein